MAFVPDPERFARALTVYFGDDSNPGYDPVKALDGSKRVAAAFPEHGAELRAQIGRMFDAAFELPGVQGSALTEATKVIEVFMASEYPFLPPVLRAKVVNCCAYGLWK